MRSDRVSKLQIPSLISCHLVGAHKCAFSVAAPYIMEPLIPRVIWQPSFLAFQQTIKIWFFTQLPG